MEPRATTSKSNRIVRIWVSVITSVIVSLILAGIILIQGRVSGIEFSPHTFQERSFSFYEIPLLERQITPIRRKTLSNSTLLYLRINGFVTTSSNPTSQWDLVSLTRGFIGDSLSDAELLLSPLSLRVDDVSYWETWSEEQPEKARFFWPIAQKLAIRELYLFLPPLFEVAQKDLSQNEFQSAIKKQIREDYLRLSDNMTGQNQPEMAQKILEAAKLDFPEIFIPK